MAAGDSPLFNGWWPYLWMALSVAAFVLAFVLWIVYWVRERSALRRGKALHFKGVLYAGTAAEAENIKPGSELNGFAMDKHDAFLAVLPNGHARPYRVGGAGSKLDAGHADEHRAWVVTPGAGEAPFLVPTHGITRNQSLSFRNETFMDLNDPLVGKYVSEATLASNGVVVRGLPLEERAADAGPGALHYVLDDAPDTSRTRSSAVSGSIKRLVANDQWHINVRHLSLTDVTLVRPGLDRWLTTSVSGVFWHVRTGTASVVSDGATHLVDMVQITLTTNAPVVMGMVQPLFRADDDDPGLLIYRMTSGEPDQKPLWGLVWGRIGLNAFARPVMTLDARYTTNDKSYVTPASFGEAQTPIVDNTTFRKVDEPSSDLTSPPNTSVDLGGGVAVSVFNAGNLGTGAQFTLYYVPTTRTQSPNA